MYKTWLIKVLLLFTAFVMLSSFVYKMAVVDRIFYNINYQLSENIDTLVVGASHLQLGFDDRSMSEVRNFSNSGMPYFFTYAKSKRLLESNPQIKRLVVSLHPIHISPYGDSRFFSDNGLSRENAFEYFPLLQDYQSLGDKRYSLDFALSYLKYKFGIPFNYMEDIKPFIISLNKNVPFEHMNFSGEFNLRETSLLNIDSVKSKAEFYFGNDVYYSKYAIDTLERIAAYTSEKRVQLFIMNMPTHKMFRDITPSIYVNKYEQLIAKLLTQYNHIKYLDYYTYDLPDDAFFDGDHLNIKGVEIMAPIFKQDIGL